ncbi:MAG: hypothetical protein N2D54_12130, partial [Chloroflexota bacterium]
SILSLAFPDENPALNRASGAMVAVFLIAAFAFEAVLRGIKDKVGGVPGRSFATGLGVMLLIFSMAQNYDMEFRVFKTQYTNSAWNTAEMGAVMANFANTVGDKDSAWVVAFPHWIDSRLVGINAGFPSKNFAIWAEDLRSTLPVPAPKMFLVKPEDEIGRNTLSDLYPSGSISLYESESGLKDFNIFFVPSED